MSDRFDLEQKIMAAWAILDDIRLLTEMDANKESMLALADIYEYKFDSLWRCFEELPK